METLDRLRASIADRYAIEREIGRGGMATVYLARDVRHHRQVALKVLEPELGAVLGAERFLTEIRVTANLQHPNLLPLFDSGEADGLLFYVMPFVEGESLRSRLERERQFPVDEAVRIAVAIANALDYAHAQGIIHRDLKPENVLLQAGQPVLADFGIALAVSRAGGARLTQTGLSLGTPLYMSPEQATGDRAIDGRTDLYSLAAITYEMLTGEPPHLGTTSQAIIAKLMTEAPRPLTTLRRNVPAHVNAAVLRGLEKLPADRFVSAREFATALATPGSAMLAPDATAAATRDRTPVRRLVAALVVAVVALVAALAVAGWALAMREPPRVTRVLLDFPDGAVPAEHSGFALSPDGEYLAYQVRDAAADLQLWIKGRSEATPRLLAPRSGPITFSPDGRWLAYTSMGSLYKIPSAGGSAIKLSDSARGPGGVAWTGDHVLFVLADPRREVVMRVSASGGQTTPWLTLPDSISVSYLTAVPGSESILFARCATLCASADLWAGDARTGEVRPVLPGAIAGLYVPRTKQLVYARPDGTLMAVAFDVGSLTARGDPIALSDSSGIARTSNGRLVSQFALSADGTLVTMPGLRMSRQVDPQRMVWVDRSGNVTPLDTTWTAQLTTTGLSIGWALSPDGRRLAIGLNTRGNDDIWVKQLPDGPLSRITFDSAAELRPRWSLNGRFVSYTAIRTSRQALHRRLADGSGSEQVVVPPRVRGVSEHAFSPDEAWVVVRSGGSGDLVGGRDISAMRVGVDSAPKPLIADPQVDEAAFALSPDARWIAFESNETGQREVFVRPFPDVGAGKWQVSLAGGRAPLWSRDGREIFFVTPAREMMVAPVAPTDATPGVGAPTRLFRFGDDLYLRENENYTPFDIAPDGRRFLMAQRAPNAVATPWPRRRVLYVESWFEELERMTKGR